MSLLKHSALLLRRVAHNTCSFRVRETRNIKRWVAPTIFELKRRQKTLGPVVETPRSSHLEWNYEAELFAFGKRLGEEFDRNLLKQALIQREYANLQEIKAQEAGVQENYVKIDNSELVKEGNDLILDYVKEVLNKSYPEDIASAVCDYLTTSEMLAHVAKHLGLTDLVLTKEFPVEELTLANTFKAVVAALKHSTDSSRSHLFIKDFLLCQLNGKDVYDIWQPKRPFEYLNGLLKKNGISEVEPRLCNQSAANTILANYQVGLYSDKKLLGIGWGENVEIAKDTAAVDAIQKIHRNYVQK